MYNQVRINKPNSFANQIQDNSILSRGKYLTPLNIANIPANIDNNREFNKMINQEYLRQREIIKQLKEKVLKKSNNWNQNHKDENIKISKYEFDDTSNIEDKTLKNSEENGPLKNLEKVHNNPINLLEKSILSNNGKDHIEENLVKEMPKINKNNSNIHSQEESNNSNGLYNNKKLKEVKKNEKNAKFLNFAIQKVKHNPNETLNQEQMNNFKINQNQTPEKEARLAKEKEYESVIDKQNSIINNLIKQINNPNKSYSEEKNEILPLSKQNKKNDVEFMENHNIHKYSKDNKSNENQGIKVNMRENSLEPSKIPIEYNDQQYNKNDNESSNETFNKHGAFIDVPNKNFASGNQTHAYDFKQRNQYIRKTTRESSDSHDLPFEEKVEKTNHKFIINPKGFSNKMDFQKTKIFDNGLGIEKNPYYKNNNQTARQKFPLKFNIIRRGMHNKNNYTNRFINKEYEDISENDYLNNNNKSNFYPESDFSQDHFDVNNNTFRKDE